MSSLVGKDFTGQLTYTFINVMVFSSCGQDSYL